MSPPEPATAVVVMAKAPEAGQVKTRLCPPLSPADAADLYRCFLLDTLAGVRALTGVRRVLAYTPATGRAALARLAPDFALMPQQGADLGARMATCFTRLLDAGHPAVVLTGSDLPTLPTTYLQQAVTRIASPHLDVVLGPSADGGYYLIALRQVPMALFANMPWSTADVLAETVRRATAERLRLAYLPTWYDIDSPADLDRLRRSLQQAGDDVAPHTRRFFSRRPLGAS